MRLNLSLSSTRKNVEDKTFTISDMQSKAFLFAPVSITDGRTDKRKDVDFFVKTKPLVHLGKYCLARART